MVERVLLAEDDPSIHAFVSRVLWHLGYQITAAYNGLDAIEALNRERYDLLITDVVMAGVDGIEVARRAARLAPEMPVLFMTGYGHYANLIEKSGAKRFEVITKPFTLQGLQHSIETLVPGRVAPASSPLAAPHAKSA